MKSWVCVHTLVKLALIARSQVPRFQDDDLGTRARLEEARAFANNAHRLIKQYAESNRIRSNCECSASKVGGGWLNCATDRGGCTALSDNCHRLIKRSYPRCGIENLENNWYIVQVNLLIHGDNSTTIKSKTRFIFTCLPLASIVENLVKSRKIKFNILNLIQWKLVQGSLLYH